MGAGRASPLARIAPVAIKRVKKSRRCIGSNRCFLTSGTAEVPSGFHLRYAASFYHVPHASFEVSVSLSHLNRNLSTQTIPVSVRMKP